MPKRAARETKQKRAKERERENKKRKVSCGFRVIRARKRGDTVLSLAKNMFYFWLT